MQQKAVKKSSFLRARHSVNAGLGQDLHRNGNAVKRSGPFAGL